MSTAPAKANNHNNAADKKGDGMPSSYGPCKILVADDEHMIATGIAATVTELGHKVVGIARDGEEAVAMARQHMPDLALLDIRMPKMTGIDAAMVLYTELAIPTVIISAYGDEENLNKINGYGTDSGVYGYLLKPVSQNELRVTIGVARQRAAVDSVRLGRLKQLEANLAQRRLVEKAKWILVEKHKMSEQQAHEKLQRVARDSRKQLSEIAQLVVDKGDLPA